MDWKRLRYVPVVFLGVLGFMLVDYAIRGHKAEQKQVTIERRFGMISDPAASSVIRSGHGFKTGDGYVTRILRTNLAQDKVEAYYREELEKGEWFYFKEEVILSHRRVLFCNGDDESIVVALPEASVPKTYEYSLTLSWYLSHGCR